MKTRIGMIGVLLVAVAFVRAAQDTPHEKALKQAVDSLDKIVATLKTIKDEDSAGAAKPELRKSAATFVDALAKGEKLDPPEKDEKERLKKLYKPKIEEALSKIMADSRRVLEIPGGKEALAEIGAIFKNKKK